MHMVFVKGNGCNVNEPSLCWYRVALLMAWSDESDCVCLCDISLINQLHYRVLMYMFVTEAGKNVTLTSYAVFGK